jgi:hypothetical protein
MQVISNVGYVLFNSSKIFCTEQEEKMAHPIHYTQKADFTYHKTIYTFPCWSVDKSVLFANSKAAQTDIELQFLQGISEFSHVKYFTLCIQIPWKPLHINDEKRISKCICACVPDYLKQMLTVVSCRLQMSIITCQLCIYLIHC